MAHYEASMRLSSMKPRLNVHARLPPVLERACLSPLGDGYLVNIQSSDALCYHLLSIQQVARCYFKILVLFRKLLGFFGELGLLFELTFELGFFVFELLFCNSSDLLMLDVEG